MLFVVIKHDHIVSPSVQTGCVVVFRSLCGPPPLALSSIVLSSSFQLIPVLSPFPVEFLLHYSTKKEEEGWTTSASFICWVGSLPSTDYLITKPGAFPKGWVQQVAGAQLEKAIMFTQVHITTIR